MNAKYYRNGSSARLAEHLQTAGIRATRQRLALATILFDGEPKHMTAEQVHHAVNKNHVKVSLATVYNSLNQFTKLGLLKEVAVQQGHAYFDTNTGTHYHFYDETADKLTDIPENAIEIKKMPHPRPNQKIVGIDIILRTKDAKKN